MEYDKETKYRSGMIFRSEKYPYADIVIVRTLYIDLKTLNSTSIDIEALKINKEEVIKNLAYLYDIDYDEVENEVYISFLHHNDDINMDKYIKKYDLKYVGMSERKVFIIGDDKKGYGDILDIRDMLDVLPEGYDEIFRNELNSLEGLFKKYGDKYWKHCAS